MSSVPCTFSSSTRSGWPDVAAEPVAAPVTVMSRSLASPQASSSSTSLRSGTESVKWSWVPGFTPREESRAVKVLPPGCSSTIVSSVPPTADPSEPEPVAPEVDPLDVPAGAATPTAPESGARSSETTVNLLLAM
jgi:hypothetical protein